MNYLNDKDDTFEVIKEEDKPKSAFEYHMVQCCRAPEFELRPFMKKVLVKAGFRLIEDNYRTERIAKDKRYERVHNLLAIRGNPDVCLVAHTDVCREHAEKSSKNASNDHSAELKEFERFIGKKMSSEDFAAARLAANNNRPYRVNPVVKTVKDKTTGEVRRIIQDQRCRFQVGGDDRLGVAINSWIALNSGYDVALYFPTDEEIGLKSARMCEIPQLKDFELLVQVDRGNHSRELVTKISGDIICEYSVAVRLLDIAYNMGLPRAPVQGAHTDVWALKTRNMCKNAVNMTCGYHNSYGADPTEYIDIDEARDTMRYVGKIVEDYYLKGRQEQEQQ